MNKKKIFLLIIISSFIFAKYEIVITKLDGTTIVSDKWQLHQESIRLIISAKKYFSNQNYKKALEELEQALTIKKEIFGESEMEIAQIYSYLGGIYYSMYDYNKALFFYKKSFKILEDYKILSEHPYIYHDLSFLYRDMGDDELALKYIKKFIKIKESYYIKNFTRIKVQTELGNSISMAKNYKDASFIYLSNKKYNVSKLYLKTSINIYERVLGKTNFLTSLSYENLGYLYYLIKDFDNSLKYLTLALKIQKNDLEQSSSYISSTYAHLALLYQEINLPCKSYNSYISSYESFSKRKINSFAILNSKQKRNYLSYDNGGIYALLDSLSKCVENNNSKIKKIVPALNSWIKYKGNLFEYENILIAIENRITDMNVTKDIAKLRIYKRQLSDIKMINKDPSKIKEIEEKINEIEIKLSKNNQNFKKILGLDKMNFKEISSHLIPTQLYIDFIKTNYNYYIFTLDKNNQVTFKKISEKDKIELEKNINLFKKNNKEVVKKITNKKLTLKEKKEVITQLKYKSQIILSNLYNTIIENYLFTQLKEKKELIISPDGLLNFLPFEALYHNGKYLIEDYKISYISSGREFVRQTKREKANPKYKMICFGNPDFNASLPISNTKDMPNLTPLDRWEDYQNFSPIGDAEINITRDMYPNALIYEKKDATIKNLMKIESPRILHFSTHGKFLINDEIKNPMLKAGLAFTGANKKLDGIATALKLSALDLKDTELVVLSACESGLGEVQNAEGVMGLPKAFLQAGARDVIMSLWSVSNQKTAELMGYFYENLKQNQNYSTALRNAKLKMIKKDMHPYYWSAFVMHGIQN